MRWLAFCLALWLAAPAWPQEAVAVGAAGRYDLSDAIAVFEDASGQLKLEDVLQRPFAPARAGPAANFGLTRSAIWLRLRLAVVAGGQASLAHPTSGTAGTQTVLPTNDADWLLELAYPPLDRMELYTPDGAGGWRQQVAGDLQPFASRVVPHRNHLLPLRLEPGRTHTVYLRLTSQGTIAAPLRLWRPAALWHADQAGYALLSLYFGLLVGLFLYNLLLFISVRDGAYLVYVLFVAAMALAQLALTGLGFQFLWPGQTWWNSVSPPAGLSTAAVFGMLFARSFLRSREGLRWLDLTLLALVGGWVLTLAAAFALPYYVSTWMVTGLAPVSVLVLVVSGIASLRRGHGGARYYLAGWALLLVGVLTLFLHNTGVLPSTPLTSNSLLIGSALEMVLLSFALADRINVARRFKEQAQARIAAEHAMVQALSDSQRRLRSLLEERDGLLQQLREALRQQQALNELRSRFVAMTSHEFRTPLAAILSAEEVLRHYGERLPPQERVETLDGIAAGVQRMSRMLDRVLLLGRADAQMLEFAPTDIHLPRLCRQLVEEARLQHPEATAQVVCDLAPELGRGLHDEKLLRHILGNLLSNALKYSPRGGEVVFSVSLDGDATVFRVQDQGIGIPEAEIVHLFDAFHRASNVGEIQGTGLGLAIVKNAVDRYGGTIAVESRLGEGTTFTVRLPFNAPVRAADPARLR